MSFQQFATLHFLNTMSELANFAEMAKSRPPASSLTTRLGKLAQCQSVQVSTPSFSCLVTCEGADTAMESWYLRQQKLEKFESRGFRIPQPPPEPLQDEAINPNQAIVPIRATCNSSVHPSLTVHKVRNSSQSMKASWYEIAV
eukprot:GHVN01092370.1.p1 GENE.GHVN01092370.1~~GHVN01092370.1.p1  ORF type:complete len:143 (-),score=11.23 GHVN01092370.1:136-564(-)